MTNWGMILAALVGLAAALVVLAGIHWKFRRAMDRIRFPLMRVPLLGHFNVPRPGPLPPVRKWGVPDMLNPPPPPPRRAVIEIYRTRSQDPKRFFGIRAVGPNGEPLPGDCRDEHDALRGAQDFRSNVTHAKIVRRVGKRRILME